jgi:hypothetical protein
VAYYPDLSPYVFGRASDPKVVNIGWLSRDQPFPTAPPRPDLVDALMQCSLAPVELYRGFHTCDLCADTGFEMMTIHYRGKRIHLGNGEIRVSDIDTDLTFAAPTLIVHYVAQHSYAPPAPFVRAVLTRARRRMLPGRNEYEE